MTREEILAAMLECKEKLGYTPSREELARHAGVTRAEIKKFFGTYTIALTVCQLDKQTNGRKVERADLFADWAGVARKLGKVPTVIEYNQHGKYSVTPYMRCFGTWTQMPLGLQQYAEENGLAEEWADVMALVAERFQRRKIKIPISAHTAGTGERAKPLNDGPLYGPLLTTCPLLCGPTNEDGVLFLFGAVAEKLGFAVLRVQAGYPDVEAFRLVAKGRWQRVRIELEYQSRNFLRHMHDLKGCDLIVCWEHNWPECPLEVIELKKVFEGMR